MGCEEICSALLFTFVDDDFEDEELMITIQKGYRVWRQQVQLFKEEGNSLFKSGRFTQAYEKYEKGVKYLAFGMADTAEEELFYKNMAISLVLNLAATSIKLQFFSETRSYCDLVICFDSGNVKALYRRGLALKEMGLLGEAREDLIVASTKEPLNQDVIRELKTIEKLIVDRSKVVGNFDPLDISLGKRKGKCILQSVKEDLPPYHFQEPGSSSGTKDSMLGNNVRSSMYKEDTKQRSLEKDVQIHTIVEKQVSRETENCLPFDWGSKKLRVDSKSDNYVSGTCDSNFSGVDTSEPMLVDKIPFDQEANSQKTRNYGDDMDCSFGNQSKERVFQFVNKKKKTTDSLLLPASLITSLKQRGDVMFYNSRSMSVLKVRVLNSKTTILKETLHDFKSWETEVSIPCGSDDVVSGDGYKCHQDSQTHDGFGKTLSGEADICASGVEFGGEDNLVGDHEVCEDTLMLQKEDNNESSGSILVDNNDCGDIDSLASSVGSNSCTQPRRKWKRRVRQRRSFDCVKHKRRNRPTMMARRYRECWKGRSTNKLDKFLFCRSPVRLKRKANSDEYVHVINLARKPTNDTVIDDIVIDAPTLARKKIAINPPGYLNNVFIMNVCSRPISSQNGLVYHDVVSFRM